jgi:hypothetical protein
MNDTMTPKILRNKNIKNSILNLNIKANIQAAPNNNAYSLFDIPTKNTEI